MIFEMIGFIGLIILALVYFSKDNGLLGLFASILILVLGFWIQASGIQIQTGQISITNTNSTTTNSSTVSFENQTISGAYVDIPTTPFTSITDMLGISFILLGIYGLAFYVVKMMNMR